jgi:hypothetical protein
MTLSAIRHPPSAIRHPQSAISNQQAASSHRHRHRHRHRQAMGNRQWATGNGQWAMGNGQWPASREPAAALAAAIALQGWDVLAQPQRSQNPLTSPQPAPYVG